MKMVLRLLCLITAAAAMQSTSHADAYDGEVVAMRVSAEKPDPRNPFADEAIGSNRETGFANPSLYLSDPAGQINNINTRFYVSVLIKFKSRTTGEYVSIHRPNPENLEISCVGRKYRKGYTPKSVGGTFNFTLNNAVWTDVADENPNPNAGKAWVYAVDNGSIVSPTGQKVVLGIDDGAVLMNPGNSDFLVHPDPDFKYSELWIVGVECSFSAGFRTGFNSTVTLAGLGIPYDAVVECKHSILVNSVLNAVNGCRTSPGYGPFRFPQIYCGTQDGPTKLEVKLLIDPKGKSEFQLEHGQLGGWVVQVSENMQTWQDLPTWVFSTTPEDPYGEYRSGMTYKIPTAAFTVKNSSPSVIRPSGFFRLWSPRPPEPPSILSRPQQ